MREYKVGEIFKHNGEWYQCIRVEDNSCNNCSLNQECMNHSPSRHYCCSFSRTDEKDVVFKRLKKIGNPYVYNGIVVQKYELETNQITIPGNLYTYFNGVENTIEIEIKQNKKEDMKINKVAMNIDDRDYLLDRLEEILHDTHCQQYKDEICEAFSKYIITENVSGLKPFNLDAAKAGKPVCTRDGRKARIICFDRITSDDYSKIVACITSYDGKDEYALTYGIDGYIINSQHPQTEDLMMPSEKKVGWVNVYTNINVEGSRYCVTIYNSKEEALNNISPSLGHYINTGKIEWEE